MFGPLTEYELEQIRQKLPPDIQALKDKYPQSVYNVSEAWRSKPFPHGYVPEDVNIYYEDDPTGADISIFRGEIINFELGLPGQKDVIKVSIDDTWAYIQVGKRVILDRLGEVILPDILLEQKALLEVSLCSIKI